MYVCIIKIIHIIKFKYNKITKVASIGLFIYIIKSGRLYVYIHTYIHTHIHKDVCVCVCVRACVIIATSITTILVVCTGPGRRFFRSGAVLGFSLN